MRNWINIFEGHAVEGADEPSITYDAGEGCSIFNGFGVHAELIAAIGPGYTIYSFSSTEPGQGNGERAIRWLKDQGAVRVVDPGRPDENPDSFAFWSNMCAKGLIDYMVDEDGHIVYRDGKWHHPSYSVTESVTGTPFEIPTVWYHSTELDAEVVAKDFANNNIDPVGTVADTANEFWFSDSWDASRYYGENTVVARLAIHNPLLVTSDQFSETGKGPSSYWAKKARAEGHDAVIIHDIMDGDMYSTVCAVFSDTQIDAKPYARWDEATQDFIKYGNDIAESAGPTNVERMFESVTGNIITLYHGGHNLESDYQEIKAHQKGRWEHGPGLYLTNDRSIALKYAKGQRALYGVTIDLTGARDIEDVEIPLEDAIEFVNRNVVGRLRETIVDDLNTVYARRHILYASTLVNLCLNHEGIANSKTDLLRHFLIDHGVDYAKVTRYGGRSTALVYVVINPRIIIRVRRGKDLTESEEIVESNPWDAAKLPTFYHGTTSRHLDDIERFGLRPQPNPQSYLRGNASTVKGYTDKNVYLTTSLMTAKSYAGVQVRHDHYNGIDDSYKVVFEVTIPDLHKLIPDDDYVNKNGSYHYWMQMKPVERLVYPPSLIDPPEFGGSVADQARELAAHQPFTKSLDYNSSVAYRGRIPAQFLKLVKGINT